MGFFLALLNFIIAIVCFMSPGGVDVEKAEEDVLENYIKRDEDEKKMEQMNPMLNYSHIQPKLNNYGIYNIFRTIYLKYHQLFYLCTCKNRLLISCRLIIVSLFFYSC